MKINDINEIINMTKMFSGFDAEGYVVYINDIPKIKIKSDSYVNIHHMIGNNVFTAKNATHIALAYEEEEYLAVLPERKNILQPYLDARNMGKETSHAVYDEIMKYLKEKMMFEVQSTFENPKEILLDKEQKKELFSWVDKGITENLEEKYKKYYNPIIKSIMLSMLKGNSFNEVIDKFIIDKKVNYLSTIMKSMNMDVRDYELRNNASRLTIN